MDVGSCCGYDTDGVDSLKEAEMLHGHQCEHTPKGNGACDRCRYAMKPRAVGFVGSKRDWLLQYKGRMLQRGKTLGDLLKMMVGVGNNLEDRNFMITCPNGVRLSIEVARGLGV